MKTSTEELARNRKWRHANKKHLRRYNKKRYAEAPGVAEARDKLYRISQKQTVLRYYGEECACCGETRYPFLTIDHINGGGKRHRDEIKRKGNTFYTWLVQNNFPPGFRTLCWNCNRAYFYFKGKCPHRNPELLIEVEALKRTYQDFLDNNVRRRRLRKLVALCETKKKVKGEVALV